MTPTTSDTCMFLSTAKAIWERMKETYSKVKDAAQIYDVKTRILGTKQGSRTVTKYSTMLQSSWQELDHFQCVETKYTEYF